MCVAFVEESVFTNQIGFRESFVDLAEFQAYFLMHVAAVAIFMNARLVNHHAFFNRRDRLQRFVFDLNQIHRVECNILIDGRNSRHRVADKAHLVDTQRVFILTNRKNTVWDRQVFSRNDGYHAGKRQGLR